MSEPIKKTAPSKKSSQSKAPDEDIEESLPANEQGVALLEAAMERAQAARAKLGNARRSATRLQRMADGLDAADTNRQAAIDASTAAAADITRLEQEAAAIETEVQTLSTGISKGRHQDLADPSKNEIEEELTESEEAHETSASRPHVKTSPDFWLLKLTTASWNVANFEVGLRCYFSTHFGNKKRPDYAHFTQVTPGEIIIGYSAASKELVCEFQVTQGINPDDSGEEKILFEVKRMFRNRIPIQEIRDHVSFYEDIQQGSLRLFKLNEPLFKAIINASHDPSLGIVLPRPTGTPETPKTPDFHEVEINISLPNYTTEGNHAETKDKLQFEHDIESLAAVMSMWSVKPPLAIGLFGKWGSGKSFFMEKLYSKVQEYSLLESDAFVKNVVQVRFNSWHYTDSNLWASIVSEIFDSLNRYANKEEDFDELKKLQGSLGITVKQRELAEDRRLKLESSIDAMQQDKEKKRKRLEDISAIGLIKAILSNKQVNEDLAKLKTEPIEKILNNVNDVNTAIGELQSFWNVVRASWVKWKDVKGIRWMYVVLFIAVLFFASTFSETVLNFFDSARLVKLFSKITLAGSSVLAALNYVIRFLTPVSRQFNAAIGRLNSVRETLEKIQPGDNPLLANRKDELLVLSTEIDALNNSITSTNKEISDILSGRKLFEFIQQGTRNENYSGQLGLISLIRKDFNRLDELLRMQHDKHNTIEVSNPLDVKLRIDRIVLYIDDLDRCNADIVLNVLEAIHLLLAFPLFVVVVGVDPRWLNNALDDKFRLLFGTKNGRDKPVGPGHEPVATSYDYLEKIFQIPFCLKPIDQPGRNSLIAYLVENEMEQEQAGTQSTGDEQQTQTDASGNVTNHGDTTDTKKTHPTNGAGVDMQKEKETRIKTLTKSLSFAKDELEFMQKLSYVYASSPRTIKRFINIYRIIKSHKSIAITGDYSEDDYAPVLILLSIVVGCSTEAEAFVRELQSTKDDTPFIKFIQDNHKSKKLLEKFGPVLHETQILNRPVREFKKNVELISRFSFRNLVG